MAGLAARDGGPSAGAGLRRNLRRVDVLALTDHDETAGLDEARAAADEAGITLVTGAELSVSWEDLTIHVVALRFDAAHGGLQGGLRCQWCGVVFPGQHA